MINSAYYYASEEGRQLSATPRIAFVVRDCTTIRQEVDATLCTRFLRAVSLITDFCVSSSKDLLGREWLLISP